MNVNFMDLTILFEFYSNNNYHKDNQMIQLVEDHCTVLLSQDYHTVVIDNEICPSYPARFLWCGPTIGDDQDEEMIGEFYRYRDTINENINLAFNCRTRQRFAIPVIRVNGRDICRSGGLAEKAELTYNNTQKKQKMKASKRNSRARDVSWLHIIKVGYIIDLMNETTHSMLGVPLCSGEGSSIYHSNFHVSSLPFPGVSFYKHMKELIKTNSDIALPPYEREDQAILVVDVEFNIPKVESWDDYKEWPLEVLTANYLLYIFHLLKLDSTENPNVLIHCISGWDRTPFFIALLRILLWSENLVHPTLNETEILYLAVGYDWLLFRHGLMKRLNENSDIFWYSFHILEYLYDSAYSFGLSDADNPDIIEEDAILLLQAKRNTRKTKLMAVLSLFDELYEDIIEKKKKFKKEKRNKKKKKSIS